MSTGQLIVTIAFVGLLGALHLVLRTARAPAGAVSVAAPRPRARRAPLMALLVLAALAALAFAGVAFVVTVLDDEDTTAPVTATTTAPATPTAPPPPQPPPPPAPAPLEAPAGTVLVARVLAQPQGELVETRNRVGEAPSLVMREEGVYDVKVPGLSPALRRKAVLRARPANGARGVMVSTRKVGPSADFMVFTRDEQAGGFAETGFEFAVFLPNQELEGAAAGGQEDEGAREQLPPTR